MALKEAAKKVPFLMAVPLRPLPLPLELKGSRNFFAGKKSQKKVIFLYVTAFFAASLTLFFDLVSIVYVC